MTDPTQIDLAARIRAIPDFPKPGILFRDIMPLLQDAQALRAAVDRMAEWAAGRQVDVVLGAESRGFILGSALAYAMNAG
ncbi:MAG TPA: adenine phosphoribosyltransferase, partial [Thermoleophilia bacterium]|nr:adenine phosphoribosyltransferase [Thermoleophilia bacterium]